MDSIDLPRILKWISQVGLVIVSAWALWDARTIREQQGDTVSAPHEPYQLLRRLSAQGWTKLTLLLVTFAFFILSDMNDKKAAIKDKKAADERTAEATRQATLFGNSISHNFMYLVSPSAGARTITRWICLSARRAATVPQSLTNYFIYIPPWSMGRFYWAQRLLTEA